MKAIPAIILMGKGANEAIVVIFNRSVIHNTIFNCFIFYKIYIIINHIGKYYTEVL